MAEVNFYLRDPKAKKETPIIMTLSADGNQTKISTGEKILPGIWNFSKQQVKSQQPGSIEINRLLSSKKNKVLSGYRQLKEKGIIPASNQIRSLAVEKTEPENPLKEAFSEFLRIKSKLLDPKTIQKYKTLWNLLNEYGDTSKSQLRFQSFNMAFEERFKVFLYEKGQLNDTVSKYVSTLKTFLQWALDHEYHSTHDFIRYSSKKTVKNEIITLNENEVNNLLELDLSSSPKLERVKDLFIFSLFTGQRWSDISSFNKADLKEGVWCFHSKKGKVDIEMPLMGFSLPALDVLEKYHFILPKISSQKFNQYIKEVCKRAGIDSQERITRFQGSKRIEIRKPKHEFVSCHTARRTFITLLLEQGIGPSVIMKMTGQRSLKTLMKYENTGKEAVLKALDSTSIITPLRIVK